MNAPIDLHGHIDEEGVRFKNYVESVEVNKLPAAWKIKCSDMEAVGFIFSVPEKCFEDLSYGCW